MYTLTRSEKLDIDSERLVRRIPFFNTVYEASAQQFSLLMDLAEIIRCDSGDTVIRKGDNDMKLYFLLKGQLGVYLDEDKDTAPISSINPGEVFGILAMVSSAGRSAYIRNKDNAKQAFLFRLDFKHLSEDSPQSRLSLDIKLIFYRMAVHNIRWTLELNKISDPNHKLVSEIRKLPYVKVEAGSDEELQVLKQQAKAMSDILFQWNESSQDKKGP
ncbi:MAG: cyclic nucleotide-binding domain-containing protein [Pseudomonadales bacterium]|nr:cyclic nucleotide-binding domain-containing protein [Pseudomonadales bacterium]